MWGHDLRLFREKCLLRAKLPPATPRCFTRKGKRPATVAPSVVCTVSFQGFASDAESRGSRKTLPLVSMAIKEVLKEKRDAVAPTPSPPTDR